MSNVGGADRDISGHSTTVTVGTAIEVDGLIVGPNMIRHYRKRIAELEAARDDCVAAAEKLKMHLSLADAQRLEAIIAALKST